jgi:hypothetical protein
MAAPRSLRVVAALAAIAPVCAQFFAPAMTTTYAFASLRAQAHADLDEDGNLDWVFVDSGMTSFVYVLLGDGQGGFGARAVSASAFLLSALAVADVDGDHHVDLLVTSATGATYLHRGRGDGTVQPHVFVASLHRPVVADVNVDGIADLVGTSPGGLLTAMVGNGSGGFTVVATQPVGTIPDLATVDLDSDGDQDVAILDRDGTPSILRVLRVSPGAAPVFEGPWQVRDQPVSGPAFGDLDGDCRLDAILVQNQHLLVSRFLGGVFQPATEVFSNSLGAIQARVLTDIDCDGRLDLVFTSVTGELRVMRGNGDATFRAPELQSVTATRVQAMDLDHDGALDLVAGDGTESRFYRNLTGAHAGTSVYATGTPDCLGYVTIGANEPATPGTTTMRVRFANAPPHAMGVGVIGGPPDPGGYQTGLGVLLHTGAHTMSSLGVFLVDGHGHGSVPLPVPDSPALTGLDAYAQGFFTTSAASQRGCTVSASDLVSSRGLAIVVQ